MTEKIPGHNRHGQGSIVYRGVAPHGVDVLEFRVARMRTDLASQNGNFQKLAISLR